MIKKTYKIKGMHCASCGFLVDEELEEIGVKSKASYQKGIVEVEFDEKMISEDDVKEAVKKAGYEIVE
ncbi:heavy-metal-associated domain-containing protein [Patescibacteria group bacterium]